jgi:biotin carboxyl carrier protein
LKIQIVIDGKTYEVEYDTTDDNSSAPSSLKEPAQSIVLPTPQGSSSSTSSAVDETKVCRSTVAGIVTQICVAASQFVKAQEVLVVVEAMKMENNLTATAGARVSSVKVKVGDTVKLGEIVVEFD